jgi:uncharacterized membrane protein YhaH (DUF805 family)
MLTFMNIHSAVLQLSTCRHAQEDAWWNEMYSAVYNVACVLAVATVTMARLSDVATS